jgi:tetratricopeptide (TPR) repeat protein
VRAVARDNSRAARWLLPAVLAIVAGVSAVRFENGFVHDDVAMLAAGVITDPGRITEVFTSHTLVAHGPSQVLPMDTYRPISLLTFFWDAWLSGKQPWSYHLTNLLLHLGAVACLFMAIRELVPSVSSWALVTASLFFGLSPQLVEAHVWINGRSDPLATLFGLAALLAFRRAARATGSAHWARALLAALLLLLGLLSKEILLCALPLFALSPIATDSWRRRAWRMFPLAASACVYLGLRAWALGGLHSSRDSEQWALALHNLPILWVDGLRELFAPAHLYMRSLRDEYAALGTLQYIGVLVAALAMAAGGVLARKRLPVLSWSLAFYAATLAPAALISAVLWPGFGRFLYLPCAGLALGLAEALAAGERALVGRATAAPRTRARMRATLSILSVTYLAFFALELMAYTRDYQTEYALYAATLREAPDGASGHARMGAYLALQGKVDEALAAYRRAIELDGSEPSYPLQAVYFSMKAGRLSQAQEIATHALVTLPERYSAAFQQRACGRERGPRTGADAADFASACGVT